MIKSEDQKLYKVLSPTVQLRLSVICGRRISKAFKAGSMWRMGREGRSLRSSRVGCYENGSEHVGEEKTQQVQFSWDTLQKEGTKDLREDL